MSTRIIQRQIRVVTSLHKKLSAGLQVLETVKTDLESMLNTEQKPVKKTTKPVGKVKPEVKTGKTTTTGKVRTRKKPLPEAETVVKKITKKPTAKKTEIADVEDRPRKKRRRRPVEA